ncbi:MAG: hypothetical protein RL187_1005, partial [Actinomycetota bacterium]
MSWLVGLERARLPTKPRESQSITLDVDDVAMIR